MFCSKCGAKLDDDSVYCDSCGVKTAVTTNQINQTPNVRKETKIDLRDIKKDNQKKSYCSSCGKELNDNVNFCSNCGNSRTNNESTNIDTESVVPKKPIKELRVASQGKRLLHLLLDYFVFYMIFAFVVGLLLGALGMEGIIEDADETVLGLVLAFIFFVIFEGIWQITPAKLLTKTKVVMKDGSKPTFAHILGRTASRFIPFEVFSFFSGSYPVGWHDSLSGTLVVSSSYSAEDVKNIDYSKKIVKSNVGRNALLVVVFIFVVLWIIGVLAE